VFDEGTGGAFVALCVAKAFDEGTGGAFVALCVAKAF